MKSANTILSQYLIPILADLPNKNINHKLLLQKDGKKCDSKVLPSINYYEPISFLKKMKEFCEEKEQSKTLVRGLFCTNHYILRSSSFIIKIAF